MTPMIDVVFQLLIFFVCTVTFQIEQVLSTSLSVEGGTARDAPPDPDLAELGLIRLRLTSDRQRPYAINDVPYAGWPAAQAKLGQLAAAGGRNLPVILEIEGSVVVDRVIEAYDGCRTSGFVKVHFAARAE